MDRIDVFYQREGSQEQQHIEADAGMPLADLLALLVKKHGLDAGVVVFIEDQDEPADEATLKCECHRLGNSPIHLHRCRHVAVAVTFNGETVRQEFAPGATVARVKRWAAEIKFGMSEEEAGEHVLQVVGTHDRPSPATHVGALVTHGQCRIAFNLVPQERVNGAPGARA
jgi:hypothetical protein